jgi:superfamily I DNA/RNA helicase
MSKFTPSAEQVAIIDAATNSDDNLLLSALAGAAKTSTLVLVAEALPKRNIICLAFNKAIATEMGERLPANCTALTLHSLGNTAWKQYLRLRRTKLQYGKMYQIIKDLSLELSDGDKKEAFDEFAFILRSCNHAKGAGHLPDRFLTNVDKAPQPVINDAELLESLDEEVSDFVKSLIIRALNISAEMAMKGEIDFDDMVLFPSLFRCMYPHNNLVLVDETQDLSPLNHRMLKQLVKKRIIAVGDQCQAIYGFRGADEAGMALMASSFGMKELTLSCSFRCPQSIVDHVLWRAPHMTAWEGTPEAPEPTYKGLYSLDEIPDGAAVICRNNAPLLSLGLALLASGRYPFIWGNDIAKGLIKKLSDLGPKNMAQEQALGCLKRYHDKQAKRVKNQKKLRDTTNCLRVLLESSDTLGEACERATAIFSAKGPLNLMTGHKAKGSEFNDVFFLDSELVGVEGQEPNLRYVICTRSKRNLTYIDSDQCIELMDEGES